jgi:uncharacterized protein (TIGR03437 family)
MISTVAGNGVTGFSGDGGAATQATFNGPWGVAVDHAGSVYIPDFYNNRVRKVTPDGTISTIAGTGVAGFSGDNGPATSAMLNAPDRVTLDSAGNLYISDVGNIRVRKVSASGIITTVAGNGNPGTSGNGGPALDAAILGPEYLLVDSSGNLYISTNEGSGIDGGVIRMVNTAGIITTVAGNGVLGFSGDGGPAVNAEFTNPRGLAIDPQGNLIIADDGNNRIRKVSNGIVTTIAGNGIAGYAGDGGPAINAELSGPTGISFDTAGNLYIAEQGNNRIRVLLADGTISTVAGNGTPEFAGDGGLALNAALDDPKDVAFSVGLIYIADTSNQRIRLLTPVPPSISASSVISASAFGAFLSISPGTWVEIYGSNLAADTRSWQGGDFNGINAPTSLDGTSVTIGGQMAFIDYISPGQVNALVPFTVATGTQQLTVTSPGGTSAAVNMTVNTVAPGLLAPPNFKINGTQYVVAQYADGTYVLPTGAISGLTSHPATSGDTIVIYGIGLGPVNPAIPAGQLVTVANSLADNFQISIGGVPCTVKYDGLAPNYTGLYQLNIVVPSGVPSGAAPLTLTVDGANGAQTLYVAVGS